MMTGIVSSAALAGWGEILPRQGVDLDQIIRECNISLPAIPTGDDNISLSDFVRFLESAGDQLRKPDFFWRAGEQYDLWLLGDVGDAVRGARTLGGAISAFSKYFSILQDSSEMTFEVNDTHATVSYRILDPKIWPRASDAEFTLGLLANLIREQIGDNWSAIDVTFEKEYAVWGDGMSDYLQTHCGYGGTTNMIRIPVAMLSLPMKPKSDRPDVLRELDQELISQKRNASIGDRTRYCLFSAIGHRDFDQTNVARELGMSRRTLRRRLESEQISYQDIVDACRMEVAALELRRSPNASLAEIALRLGYTEHSSFSRAFSRWSGVAPQHWRQQWNGCHQAG